MKKQKHINLSVDGINEYRKAEFEKMMKMSKEERKEYMRNKACEGQKFGNEIKRRARKDWNFQDAKAKVELLKKYNIPVWVMEPLRGGRLVNLTDEEKAKLKAMNSDETIPAWAFRFLQSLPEVTMILSGMSDLEQMKENIQIFQEDKPLSEEELNGLLEMADEMVQKIVLPFSACHYCVSHCPQGLDIPTLLAFYNEHSFTEGGFIAPMALSSYPEDKLPSACLECRSCEAVCPQQIKISEAMADFSKKLNM